MNKKHLKLLEAHARELLGKPGEWRAIKMEVMYLLDTEGDYMIEEAKIEGCIIGGQKQRFSIPGYLHRQWLKQRKP